MSRTFACIGLLSAAVIAFQIALVQILSVTQWYHFAYMVISVALLGFGASGTLLALARTWFLDRYEHTLPIAVLSSGVSMTLSVAVSQLPWVRFDSYLLFVDASQVVALAATYLILTIPFFFAGLAIGLVFVKHTARIGGLYSANLVGSAVGGGIGLALLYLAQPQALPALTALIAAAAAMFVLPGKSGGYRTATLASTLLALGFVLRPPGLVISEYKGLAQTLQLSDVEIVLVKPDGEGLIHVVRGPSLRNAPGLSLAYNGEVPVQDMVFTNADFSGAVASDSASLLRYTTAQLPYAMQQRDSVLVLGAGTGENVAHALANTAGYVTAVEPHRGIANILSTSAVLKEPGTSLVVADPRSYLAMNSAEYDLIVLPTVGSFGGGAGLFAVREQYGLTVDAFVDALDHLAPSGGLGITTWMDYPYRRPLRLAGTIVEALRRQGVETPSDHIAAVRGWGTVTFAVSLNPLDDTQIARIRQMCDELFFDPVLLPGLMPEERSRYNTLQDESLFAYLDQIVEAGTVVAADADSNADVNAGASADLDRDYDFRIAPTSDNRPYFSQFIRWNRLSNLFEYLDASQIPFLELGTLIVGVTVVQTLLAAIVLILLPLVRIGWRGRGRWWTLLHFGGLGLGYMFVEMVLIQRFTLYFGHPILSVVVVLTVLLLFSGLGSYFSSRVPARYAFVAIAAGIVALLTLLLTVALTPLLKATIALGMAGKLVVSACSIGVVALAMGFPFPLGLRLLSGRDEAQVPWAWGVNGCLSVVSTGLATLWAIEAGFIGVMATASVFYGVVTVAGLVATLVYPQP